MYEIESGVSNLQIDLQHLLLARVVNILTSPNLLILGYL